MSKLRGIGAAWMRREDWPRWLAIDPLFQPDYGHWLRRMEAIVAQQQAAGVAVIKVMLDPDEFLAWGKANGKGVGTLARAEYAALLARQSDEREQRV